MIDYYSLSLRAARIDAMRAFRADLPGYIAGLLAGPILLFGVAVASLIEWSPV
jgi:hypothetical protein